jgi:hypothetical protein
MHPRRERGAGAGFGETTRAMIQVHDTVMGRFRGTKAQETVLLMPSF